MVSRETLGRESGGGINTAAKTGDFGVNPITARFQPVPESLLSVERYLLRAWGNVVVGTQEWHDYRDATRIVSRVVISIQDNETPQPLKQLGYLPASAVATSNDSPVCPICGDGYAPVPNGICPRPGCQFGGKL